MGGIVYRLDCDLFLNVYRDFTRYPLNNTLPMSKNSICFKDARFHTSDFNTNKENHNNVNFSFCITSLIRELSANVVCCPLEL